MNNKRSKINEGKANMFKETLPIRKMNQKQREDWNNLYVGMGRPQGHTISSTDSKKVCDCVVCVEMVKRIKAS
jgi:hypothetical protein